MNKNILGVATIVLALGACSDKYSSGLNGDSGVWGNYEPGSYEELKQTVGDRILFALNSSTLDDSAMDILKKQIEWLKGNNFEMIEIEGHADERGTSEYNLALGNRRAHSVKQFFIELGIDSEKITTISYGKERPEMMGHNESSWSKNRRAVIVVQ